TPRRHASCPTRRSSDLGSGPRPDSNRRKQVLEQFPLDSLDMVGTLHTGASMVALVMAPDKVTYRVSPGVYLGQNDGRGTSVQERSEEHTSELQSREKLV